MKKLIIDGFSASLWKSLAVKSLRLGWPVGLQRAQAALGKSELKALLTCGVFEDVFPATSELRAVMQEIRSLDYAALCRRQTHHGRGLTQAFYDLRKEAIDAAQNHKPELWADARPYGLWLPPRSLNCWFTWLRLAPTDAGQTREVDPAPWTGMPQCMADAHTLEGKRAGVEKTIVSGHYSQHVQIAQLVALNGWEHVRALAHEQVLPAPESEQPGLI